MKDLSRLHKPGLTVTFDGHEYTMPPVMADRGLRLRMQMNDPTTVYTDDGELREIMALFGAQWVPNNVEIDVMHPDTGVPMVDDKGEIVTTTVDHGEYRGGVYDELRANGVAWDDIMRIGKYVMIHTGLGEVFADAWMASEADPSGNPPPPETGEPEFPNREAKRAASKGARKAGTSKAATGRSTAGRKRTAKTTPAAGTTTPVSE